MYSVHDGKLLVSIIHSCFPIFNLPHTLNKMHMNETLNHLIKEIAETNRDPCVSYCGQIRFWHVTSHCS